MERCERPGNCVFEYIVASARDHTYPHSDRLSYSYAHNHSDTRPYSDTYAHSDLYPCCDGYTHRHTHTEGNTDAETPPDAETVVATLAFVPFGCTIRHIGRRRGISQPVSGKPKIKSEISHA
jgi:hypothetical protein